MLLFSIMADLIGLITTKYTRAESVLDGYKSKLNDYRKMYLCQADKRAYGLANVYVPEFFKAVETLVSNMYQIIFSEDPFFTMLGRENSDEARVPIMQGLMNFFIEKTQLKNKFFEILRQFVIDGIVFVKITWKSEERRVTKKMPMDVGYTEPETAIVDETELQYDAPCLELVDMLDIYIDPTVSSVDEAEWIIERKKMTYNQLMKLKEQGLIDEFDDEAAMIRTAKNKGAGDNQSDRLMKERLQGLGINAGQLEKREYEILEYWGLLPKSYLKVSPESGHEPTPEGGDGDKIEVECRAIICLNTKKILKVSENPYWHKRKPYVGCSMFKMDNSLFSMALGDMVKSTQLELNESHNQLLDFNSFNLYNMWKRRRDSGVDKKKLKAAPGLIVDCDVMEGLEALRPQANSFFQGQQADNIMREDIKQATGALADMQGVAATKRKTAFEVQALIGAGGTRVKNYVMNLNENLLKPMLHIYYSLIQQYMDQGQVVRIVGKEGVLFGKIMPEDVYGNFDFVPKLMTDYQNRITIRENLLQFLQIAAPMVQAGVINPQVMYKVVRRIYDSFEMKDGNEIMPLNEQPSSAFPATALGSATPEVAADRDLDDDEQAAAEEVLGKLPPEILAQIEARANEKR